MKNALSQMVEIFTSHSEKEFDDVMSSGLQPIADAVGLDRVAVYRLFDKESGRMGQIYVWAHGKTVPLDEELVELPKVPPVIRWLEVLTKGESVNGNVQDMPQDQADFCALFGIKSILFVPIFTHGDFWGVITLEDHTNYRYFDTDNLDLLHSAAHICANAIIRNENTLNAEEAMKKLRRSEELTRTLNRVGVKFISYGSSFEETMTEGVSQIAEAMSVERISVFRNIPAPDGLHASQIYRWHKVAGGTTTALPELKYVAYSKLAPRWETYLAEDNEVNGPVRLLPEAEMLKSFNVVSTFVAPIFINNSFWGFAIFEDHEEERYFDRESVEMMRSAAFLCANTVLRAEMEREIIDANKFSRAILNIMPAGFTIFDDQFNIIDCNNTILDMFGTTRQYYLDNFYEFLPEYQSDGRKSVDVAREVLSRALAGEKTVFECQHLSSSGELIPFEVTMARTEYKEKYILQAHQYDLRIRKKLMDSIYEQNQQLISLNKAKDDFLSKISHEIRTPMNAIMGITEIQLQHETHPQRKEALGIIYNSGDSLLRIVNDLLDLSKIEAKKLEIIPAKYDVASLINDTAQLNMVRIESKPIKFKLNVDENIPLELWGDELRIKQILNNILSNAFKYTDSGEVSMSVWAESVESGEWRVESDANLAAKEQASSLLNTKSGNNSQLSTLNSQFEPDVYIVFKISDTGRGMTEKQMLKIFDEYSRFNMGQNAAIEGTGLGMTITQNLVSLMNGHISVDSELGKGSIFTVRLPQKIVGSNILGKEMKKNLQRFRISSSSQINKLNIERDPMPYGKVLVVDDVESNLYVAKHFLEIYDLSVETALSGFEAIEKIKSGKVYDIVFMDHMMPKMDGIETVRRIRELGYTHPIVALTANAVAGQAELFLKNNFDSFVSKPINTLQLNTELNRFIRDKQPPEVIAAARKQKSDEENKKNQKTAFKMDMDLYSIFARDAKKALPILEETLKNIDNISEENLHMFTIKVHAMKSALANIEETVLSQNAFVLERAGREGNKAVVKAQTQEFIDALKEIIAETEVAKKGNSVDQDENPNYLREQLKLVCEACEKYDVKAVNSAIGNLREMSWTRETEEFLDKISELLLLSDFEAAQSEIKSYVSRET